MSAYGSYSSDPTLVSSAPSYDANATLVGAEDNNATLVGGGGGGGAQFASNISRQPVQQPTIVPHIRMVPHNSAFSAIDCDVPRTVKFGRVTEPPTDEADFVGFNSKVVSRRHAEIWTVNNEFYIRDTKSQSGTFLNAMRLSLPGEESKPFKLKNGDAIQFGVDRRGSNADDMKCVAMTIELSFRKVTPQQNAGGMPAMQPALMNRPVSVETPPLGNAGLMSDLTLVMNQQQTQPPYRR